MREQEGDQFNGEQLARFIAGECSEEEREAILTWIRADASRTELMRSMEEVWGLADEGNAWNIDAAWADFLERRSVGPTEDAPARASSVLPLTPRRRRIPVWGVKAAAAVMILVGGAVVWNELGAPTVAARSVEPREYSTGPGERTDVRLPDGTAVTLAPESRIQMARGYGDNARELHLQGQAYFEVQQDPRRPFRVHSRDIVTEVLGTRFVVRAYDGDSAVEIALAEGSVRVGARGDADPSGALMLRPGQAARLSGGTARLGSEASAARLLALAEGRLIFNDTPFSEAARDLGRWYDIDVRLSDPALAERRITASFGNESVEQILELIALSISLNYERDGRTIVFSDR